MVAVRGDVHQREQAAHAVAEQRELARAGVGLHRRDGRWQPVDDVVVEGDVLVGVVGLAEVDQVDGEAALEHRKRSGLYCIYFSSFCAEDLPIELRMFVREGSDRHNFSRWLTHAVIPAQAGTQNTVPHEKRRIG